MATPTAVGPRWDCILAARALADVGDGLASILALSGATNLISFSGGFPDPATFPGDALVEILEELIRSGDPAPFQYAPTEGLPGPRDFVAGRLEQLEGLRPDGGELLITSGAIEALELIGKACLDPGDVVLVEAPTYLGAIMAFRSFEVDVRGIPTDDDGIAVDALEDELGRLPRAKLLYTIPDHQNPTGVSMSAERRLALIDVARRHGLLLVEDVAYRELSFGAPRLDSLWRLAPDTSLQVGTFSKTFFPGVRLGWTAGPAEIVRQLVRAKQTTDQCAGALGQALLEAFGRRGLLEPQIDRARTLYASRCRFLLQTLDEEMPPAVTWTRPEGGFFIWVTLPEGLDSVDLARQASDAGVAFVPGPPFFPDGQGRRHLRLSFSRVSEEQILEGGRRFAGLVGTAMQRGT